MYYWLVSKFYCVAPVVYPIVKNNFDSANPQTFWETILFMVSWVFCFAFCLLVLVGIIKIIEWIGDLFERIFR